MEKKVLEYGDDWVIETTKNMYKVYWLPYDDTTCIGIQKKCISEIIRASANAEIEPELIALLFAAIKFNRKTISSSNRCRKLTISQINEGITALMKTWKNLEYDDVLNVFIHSKTQDVEIIITSDNPTELLEEIIYDR